MQNIALAKKVNYTETEQFEGTITIEPLFPGYGMTLGNSLRRVLLSSLPGAAVVGVKIKGASHEFMALKGIKEDVLEIILNLKQLRLKVFPGEEEIRLELKAKGKKVVTAADITKNSQVEIKNPDLEIANLTDSTANLEIEIFVKEGRGYKMPEGAKRENKELGYIEIDSIFSPVISVASSVEHTRVGRMTNWDKLILQIKTDGTISPEEAFKNSVQILVEQYQAFLAEPVEEEEEPKETGEVEAVEEKEVEVVEELPKKEAVAPKAKKPATKTTKKKETKK
ncbi:MAG: DNA-directed RNA polymerase subunit alpha [Patescibacteria group bacterium]|jgi:DNA-directed RNA polymerase subunit alpha